MDFTLFIVGKGKSPLKGLKITKSAIIQQICQLESKNWQNLKTNWYKHFIIHFKHPIGVKFDLSSIKVCKRTQNDQKCHRMGSKSQNRQ